FSSRRRHTRFSRDWSSDVCSSDLSYDFTEKFSLGLNAANYSFKTDGGYQGVALYPKYSITENVQIGARGEYFKFKDVGAVDGASVTSLTLSGKLTHGGLSLIPEFRFDSNDSKPFLKSDFTTATKSASQVSLARSEERRVGKE